MNPLPRPKNGVHAAPHVGGASRPFLSGRQTGAAAAVGMVPTGTVLPYVPGHGRPGDLHRTPSHGGRIGRFPVCKAITPVFFILKREYAPAPRADTSSRACVFNVCQKWINQIVCHGRVDRAIPFFWEEETVFRKKRFRHPEGTFLFSFSSSASV